MTQVQLEVLRLMGADNLDRFREGEAFQKLLVRVSNSIARITKASLQTNIN